MNCPKCNSAVDVWHYDQKILIKSFRIHPRKTNKEEGP